MALQLDHIVIAVRDLDTAIQDYRDLGFTVVRGGVHANHATHNALITFSDGIYLELLAATGKTPIADLVDFSVLLKDGEGFVGFALRSADLETDAVRLRAGGFAVGEIIPGERQRADGTVIQWKLALLNDGFAPFLIQDVTPQEWRIPSDSAIITHANRAVGVRGVEIAVRDMAATQEFYTKLVGMSPQDSSSNYCSVGPIELEWVYKAASRYTLSGDDWPSYLKMFGGHVPQAAIDAADPALEPARFESSRSWNAEKRAAFRATAARERDLLAALKIHPAVLSAVRLIREQGADSRFTPERTHGVHFHQLLGTPPSRGEAILVGLDSIDWKRGRPLVSDIPNMLRGLASDDVAVRDDAFEMLEHAITHQGDVYDEAFEVAPFLIRLLDAPEIEDKVKLIALLEGIDCGFTRPEQRDQVQTLLRDVLPVYLKLLDHPDHRVRWMVVRQLYLYDTEVGTLAPLLQARVTSDVEPSVRAECVGALAALWTGAPEVWMIAAEERPPRKLSDEHTAYFAGLMRDTTQPLAVQYRAARTLVRDDPGVWLDAVLDLFYRVMQNNADVIKSLRSEWLGSVFYDVIYVLPGHLDRVLDWVIAQAQHPAADVRRDVPYVLAELVRAGQPVTRMIPVVAALMRDPSPDVRESAVGFFYDKPYANQVAAVLEDLATHDPSLTVRTVAGHALKFMSPGGHTSA